MTRIEEHIRKAIEEGKFKDLPGAGKPLALDQNPYEDPEWRTAYRMLKEGGFSLPWIESRKAIEEALNEARTSLARASEWHSKALESEGVDESVAAEWQRAKRAFRTRIEHINKQIESYNLETPSNRFQLLPLNIEREMEAIIARKTR